MKLMMQHLKTLSVFASVLVLGLLSITGCGAGSNKPVPVSGTVTLDGDPLPFAGVVFSREGVRSVSAMTDENGHYELTFASPSEETNGQPVMGATPGEYRVSITLGVGADEEFIYEDDEDDEEDEFADWEEEGDFEEEQLPARYNSDSELTFTVSGGGSSSADFDLTSD